MVIEVGSRIRVVTRHWDCRGGVQFGKTGTVIELRPRANDPFLYLVRMDELTNDFEKYYREGDIELAGGPW